MIVLDLLLVALGVTHIFMYSTDRWQADRFDGICLGLVMILLGLS